jgi:glycosyltransferase involved in cell wall biosynthesis
MTVPIAGRSIGDVGSVELNLADPQLLPFSAVIPTRDRAGALKRTLNSLRRQNAWPSQIIIVDASNDDASKLVATEFANEVRRVRCEVTWSRATIKGAAVQRNQGVAMASFPVVGFFDDDILFEPDCIERLWQALLADPQLGAVNAMITNQSYQPPGFVSRMMFRAMAGKSEASYAGRLLGPAVNLLPEDRYDLPDVVPVEWLNLGCTFYRREALPDPPFSEQFVGYSMLEDVTLSLIVGRRRRLANVRTARIYHDSQPGSHKNDVVAVSRMELVNRHYVMTAILQRRHFRDYARLALWEWFQLTVCALRSRFGLHLWKTLWGKVLGTFDILIGAAT